MPRAYLQALLSTGYVTEAFMEDKVMENSKADVSESEGRKTDKKALISSIEESFTIADAVENAIDKRIEARVSRGDKISREKKIDRESAISSLDESFAFDDAVETKINERIKTHLPKANAITQEAVKAFSNFIPSKVSAEIRKEITYLAQSDDLKVAQETIINEDLKQMEQIPTKHGFSVSLSDKDINELGLVKADDGTVSGTPQADKVMDYIDNRMQQTDLYANSDLLTDCKVKKEAEKVINQITNPDDSDSSTVAETVTSEESNELETTDLTLDQLVKDKVALQMEHATSPEANLKFGISDRATQGDITEAANTFKLSGGPADVTAYHDFYDLQIAFRHVWTELFDKELITQGKKVFAELAKYRDDYDAESIKDDTVNSAEQLKQLMNNLKDVSLQIAGEDPRLKEVNTCLLPEITSYQWASLDNTTKNTLYNLVLSYQSVSASGMAPQVVYVVFKEKVDAARKILNGALRKKSRIENFFEDLEERIKENYAFHVFATDPKNERACVNYGILVNYRQEWKPQNYQVGELVSTLPLAPKEIRRYSTKRVVKKNRAEKEIENALQIRKEDSSDTYRDHTEIVRRATNKTNFQHTPQGGVNFAVWNAKGSHSITLDSAKHSSQVKKEFREAVLKSAQEYKNEHKLEISTTSSEEFEETTSGEISNPNDEIPVTYLFYELQRTYEISEKIHKLTPVILVANDVPYPNKIDEDWLLAHDWILRRVILDDSFITALDYLSDTFVGDEISTEVMRNNFETQLDVVEKVAQQVSSHSNVLETARKAADKMIEEYAKTQVKESEGLFESVWEGVFGGDEDASEMLRIKMEAAKEAFQRAERQEKELRSRLESEVTALESATDKYARALEEQFNRRTQILRLRVHVKDNILYYMQAIWDQEPPDQRFFRLYNLDVPDIKITPGFSFTHKQSMSPKDYAGFIMSIIGTVTIKKKKLVEVADLDNLLGYKGNYMIFPLKKNNYVTMHMMQDYMDLHETARLWDPDEAGNYTIDEMKELIKCYYKYYPESFTDEVKDKYRDLLIKRLTDPHPDKDIVIVPTDSLFIEALPGKHPILEDFKLIHRVVDVKKVQSEVRHSELENVRLAARALKGEYEDPDIEKKIVIEGDAKDVNVSTG
ncbi:hypothetical protein C5S39_05405 [Candidatus Methanophagaceae archaeon]|nr:hypothetical protein C5S39_05405 [Methanophagales archaeon]